MKSVSEIDWKTWMKINSIFDIKNSSLMKGEESTISPDNVDRFNNKLHQILPLAESLAETITSAKAAFKNRNRNR